MRCTITRQYLNLKLVLHDFRNVHQPARGHDLRPAWEALVHKQVIYTALLERDGVVLFGVESLLELGFQGLLGIGQRRDGAVVLLGSRLLGCLERRLQLLQLLADVLGLGLLFHGQHVEVVMRHDDHVIVAVGDARNGLLALLGREHIDRGQDLGTGVNPLGFGGDGLHVGLEAGDGWFLAEPHAAHFHG